MAALHYRATTVRVDPVTTSRFTAESRIPDSFLNVLPQNVVAAQVAQFNAIVDQVKPGGGSVELLSAPPSGYHIDGITTKLVAN
jgi:hypothetical protein